MADILLRKQQRQWRHRTSSSSHTEGTTGPGGKETSGKRVRASSPAAATTIITTWDIHCTIDKMNKTKHKHHCFIFSILYICSCVFTTKFDYLLPSYSCMVYIKKLKVISGTSSTSHPSVHQFNGCLWHEHGRYLGSGQCYLTTCIIAAISIITTTSDSTSRHLAKGQHHQEVLKVPHQEGLQLPRTSILCFKTGSHVVRHLYEYLRELSIHINSKLLT